jgi:hypothetical protein
MVTGGACTDNEQNQGQNEQDDANIICGYDFGFEVRHQFKEHGFSPRLSFEINYVIIKTGGLKRGIKTASLQT